MSIGSSYSRLFKMLSCPRILYYFSEDKIMQNTNPLDVEGWGVAIGNACLRLIPFHSYLDVCYFFGSLDASKSAFFWWAFFSLQTAVSGHGTHLNLRSVRNLRDYLIRGFSFPRFLSRMLMGSRRTPRAFVRGQGGRGVNFLSSQLWEHKGGRQLFLGRFAESERGSSLMMED